MNPLPRHVQQYVHTACAHAIINWLGSEGRTVVKLAAELGYSEGTIKGALVALRYVGRVAFRRTHGMHTVWYAVENPPEHPSPIRATAALIRKKPQWAKIRMAHICDGDRVLCGMVTLNNPNFAKHPITLDLAPPDASGVITDDDHYFDLCCNCADILNRSVP